MSFGPNPTFLAIAMSLALCLFVAVGPPYPTHSGNVGAVLGECSYGVARLPSRNPSCPRPSHAHTASYSIITLGVPAWERSVGRPSRNRLENGHANHHRYRITTPVLKMHLDRAATRISTYSVLAGRRWPPARQSQCRSRVARRACVSSLRPTRYHRCGTADTPCRPKLNAIRRPGCTS